jgi:hypothetical protein
LISNTGTMCRALQFPATDAPCIAFRGFLFPYGNPAPAAVSAAAFLFNQLEIIE